MKLVDILARDLKVWPDNALADCAALFVAQDSDGMIVTLDPEEKPIATQFRGCDWSRSHWTGIDLTLGVSDDHASAIVTREQWQAAVDALNPPAWNGEGLPPVGKGVCEYRGAHQWDVWTVVNIFAEWGEGSRRVVFVDFGDGWREERHAERFRPIRTAEQIAAEEKHQAILQMVYDLNGALDLSKAMEALYSAGYRKQADA